jgi:cell division septum initiation protein DivIVA
MDSIEKLTTAIAMVEEARGVPLSASCVLHRGEILEVLDGARAALPNDLDAARKIIASRDALIEEGRLSAEALVASAREEVSRMIEQTAIVSAAREEAQHILDDAHIEADSEREEVEKYIDSRLATLEVILNKTSDAVARGRERLAGAGDKDVLSQLANDK